MNLRKLVQRRFLSFLASRWGMAACLVGTLFLLNTCFSLLSLLLPAYFSAYSSSSTSSSSSLDQPYSPARAGSPLAAIDVVYTWVNGSDPRLLQALKEARAALAPKGNLTASAQASWSPHSSINSNLGQESTAPSPVSVATNANATAEPRKENVLNDADSMSRFVDNEELRFSLRSIEMYAPWVRNIYIVTNGQIPYWLDLSHPRLKIVTHEEIFLNKSHLPTFSSPAIECHLHRIPGLSDKFLYLNDDTMFGAPVWLDDFYSAGRGQKVYLAWPVPDCSDGCPSSWIGDGYCDRACNTSSCNWDGGDCVNATSSTLGSGWHAPAGNTWSTNSWGANLDYCAPGCPDSWIGDKYCDKPCQVPDCALDAGDCGIKEVKDTLWGFAIYNATLPMVQVPSEIAALYIDLAPVLGTNEIIDGSHDNADIVRTATISQKHKTMTLVLRKNKGRQVVGISVEALPAGTVDRASPLKLVVSFNITVGAAAATANANALSFPSTSPPPSDAEVEIESSPLPVPSLATSPDELVEHAGEVRQDTHDTEDDGAYHDSRMRNRDLKQILDEIDLDQVDMSQPRRQSTRKLLLLDSYEVDSETTEQPTKSLADLWKSYAPTTVPMPQGQLTSAKKLGYERAKTQAAEEARVAYLSAATEYFRDRPIPAVFPWERPAQASTFLNQTSTRRHLLDAFGDSLRHVNRLLDQEFGPEPRKVIAHMPHFLDKHILNALHARWPEEFNRTSSHRFRTGDDMQFAFSYMYFMMHQKPDATVKSVWAALDGDKSGALDYWELRTLYLRAYGAPLVPSKLHEFLDKLRRRCGPVPSPSVSPLVAAESSFTTSASSPPSLASTSSALDGHSLTTAPSGHSASGTAISSPAGAVVAAMEMQITYATPATTSPVVVSPSSAADQWASRYNNRYGGVSMGFEPGSKENEEDKKRREREEAEEKAKVAEEIEHFDRHPVTLDALFACPDIMDKIQRWFTSRGKNNFEIVGTENDVAFVMINANPKSAQERLDGIIAKPRKFVCINDDIDHSAPESVETLAIIRRFYESMYPLPSSFELAPGRANPYLHMSDLIEAQKVEDKQRALWWLSGLVVLGGFGVWCVRRCWSSRQGRSFSRDRLEREDRTHKLLRL